MFKLENEALSRKRLVRSHRYSKFMVFFQGVYVRACVCMRLTFLIVMFQASPPSFVSGAIEGSHPAGIRLQPPHHSGTAQQGQNTHKGKRTSDELLNRASDVEAVA